MLARERGSVCWCIAAACRLGLMRFHCRGHARLVHYSDHQSSQYVSAFSLLPFCAKEAADHVQEQSANAPLFTTTSKNHWNIVHPSNPQYFQPRTEATQALDPCALLHHNIHYSANESKCYAYARSRTTITESGCRRRASFHALIAKCTLLLFLSVI